jgi:phage gpG-like protein
MAHTVSDLAASIHSLEDILRKLPDWAGREAVNFYKDSFTRQAYIDNKVSKWAKRKNDPKSKRGNRAILVQSGALRRSIRYKVSGNNVTVYTDVPYAQVHNEGLQVQSTQSVSSFSRKGKNGKKQTVKAHTRKRDFKMPQRQFMDVPNGKMSAFLEQRFVMHIGRALEKAFR